MNSIVVSRDELIKILNQNLRTHILEYYETYTSYLMLAEKKIKVLLSELSKNIDNMSYVGISGVIDQLCYANNSAYAPKVSNTKEEADPNTTFVQEILNGSTFSVDDKVSNFNLTAPENHIEDYIRVLRMLNMSVEDKITLSEVQFNQYVMDNWHWTRSFKTMSATYSKLVQ